MDKLYSSTHDIPKTSSYKSPMKHAQTDKEASAPGLPKYIQAEEYLRRNSASPPPSPKWRPHMSGEGVGLCIEDEVEEDQIILSPTKIDVYERFRMSGRKLIGNEKLMRDPTALWMSYNKIFEEYLKEQQREQMDARKGKNATSFRNSRFWTDRVSQAFTSFKHRRSRDG